MDTNKREWLRRKIGKEKTMIRNKIRKKQTRTSHLTPAQWLPKPATSQLPNMDVRFALCGPPQSIVALLPEWQWEKRFPHRWEFAQRDLPGGSQPRSHERSHGETFVTFRIAETAAAAKIRINPSTPIPICILA